MLDSVHRRRGALCIPAASPPPQQPPAVPAPAHASPASHLPCYTGTRLPLGEECKCVCLIFKARQARGKMCTAAGRHKRVVQGLARSLLSSSLAGLQRRQLFVALCDRALEVQALVLQLALLRLQLHRRM